MRLALVLLATFSVVLVLVTRPQDAPRDVDGAHPLPSPGSGRSESTSTAPFPVAETAADRVAAAPTAEGAWLRVLVLDQLEQPVEAARLSSGARELGATGADGRADLLRADCEASGLSVEHDLFRQARVPPSAFGELDADGRLIVHLAHAGRLRGRVERGDGQALDRSVQVLALPSRLTAEGVSPDWSRWLEEADTLLIDAEQDGSFAFDGLNPRESYLLFAGGGCLSTSGPGKRARADDPEIVLIVDEVFVARLSLKDPSHGALRGPHRFLAASLMVTGPAPAGFEWMLLSPIQRDLAGVPPGERDEIVPCVRRVGPGVGYASFSGHPIGYEPVSVEVPYTPCAEARPPVEVVLNPTAEGWGRLVVRLPPEPAAGLAAGPLGVLVLTEPSRPQLRYPLRWPVGTDLVLQDVPWGQYELAFEPDTRVLSGLRSVHPGRVEIGPGTAEIELVPEASLGSVLVELEEVIFPVRSLSLVVLEGHLERTGSALIHRRADPIRCFGARSLIPWARPGSYTVLCTAPRPYAGWSASIEVVAGEQAEAKLRPPETEIGVRDPSAAVEALLPADGSAKLIRLGR